MINCFFNSLLLNFSINVLERSEEKQISQKANFFPKNKIRWLLPSLPFDEMVDISTPEFLIERLILVQAIEAPPVFCKSDILRTFRKLGKFKFFFDLCYQGSVVVFY